MYFALLSPASIPTILEAVFLAEINSCDDSDCYQFEFKAGHTFDQCTVIFIHVYVLLDKVDYWPVLLISSLVMININDIAE